MTCNSNLPFSDVPLSSPSEGDKTAYSRKAPVIRTTPDNEQDWVKQYPAKIKTSADTLHLEIAQPNGALYRACIAENTCGWVVMRYRTHKTKRSIFGNEVVAGSFRRPSPSDFGRYAWQYTTNGRKKALRKLEGLSK